MRGSLQGMEGKDREVAIGKCCSNGVSYCNVLLRNTIGEILREGKEMWLGIS